MPKRLAVTVLFLMPVVVFAQATTRPSEAPRARSPEGQFFMPRHGEIPESEFKEAYEFFEKFSPKRTAAFNGMEDDHKARFKPLIVARYYEWKWLGKDNPELRGIKEKQIRVEDAIFGIKLSLHDVEDPSERTKLEKELKEKVEELVQARMDEREQRLKRLAELVKEERKKLEKDREEKSELVERKYKEILEARDADVAADGGGRRPPAGPDRGGQKGQRRER